MAVSIKETTHEQGLFESIGLRPGSGTFTEIDDIDAPANDTAPAPDQPPARNFRLLGDRALATG